MEANYFTILWWFLPYMICFCIFKECIPFSYLRRLWKCDASPDKCWNLWPFPFWRFIMYIKILKVLLSLEIKKKILLNFVLSSIYQTFWIQTTFLHYTWVLLETQFSSVTQLCLTLCDPMDCSMPGLPVHHQLPELTQTHIHRVSDAIQPSHPLSSPSPPTFNLSQHEGLFKWVSTSHELAKVLEFQLQHQSFQWIPRTDLL